MSKSREPEKPVSSETSSDDDSSSEEIESESESILKSSAPPAAARKRETPSATQLAPPDEDSGSESDSESESESHKKSRKKSKAKGKDKAASASASLARSTRKRALEEVKGTEPTVTKKSKTSKKAEAEASQSEKKQLFQRIWGEGDEIAVLNGIMQFRAEKKSEPNDNWDSFHDFIKENLHIDVTRKQLSDKMSEMKKKYTTNKRKEQEGKGPTFTSQHEQEAYDLSEKVWGAEKENGVEKANGSGAEKENGVEKASGNGMDTNNIEDSRASENLVEEGEMRVEEDEALNKLEIEEMEIYVKHFEVKTKMAKLFLEMMKSRGH